MNEPYNSFSNPCKLCISRAICSKTCYSFKEFIKICDGLLCISLIGSILIIAISFTIYLYDKTLFDIPMKYVLISIYMLAYGITLPILFKDSINNRLSSDDEKNIFRRISIYTLIIIVTPYGELAILIASIFKLDDKIYKKCTRYISHNLA